LLPRSFGSGKNPPILNVNSDEYQLNAGVPYDEYTIIVAENTHNSTNTAVCTLNCKQPRVTHRLRNV
jgi:hypothetical protein